MYLDLGSSGLLFGELCDVQRGIFLIQAIIISSITSPLSFILLLVLFRSNSIPISSGVVVSFRQFFLNVWVEILQKIVMLRGTTLVLHFMSVNLIVI